MRRASILILTATIVLIMAGIFLTIFLTQSQESFQRNVFIETGGVTRSTLEFSVDKLVPGDQAEYSINMKTETGGSFRVVLDFVTVVDGELKNYVDVVISYGGEVVCEKSLADLLAADFAHAPIVNCDIESGEEVKINVTYKIDESHGNEMENTRIDFNIEFTANRMGVSDGQN